MFCQKRGMEVLTDLGIMFNSQLCTCGGKKGLIRERNVQRILLSYFYPFASSLLTGREGKVCMYNPFLRKNECVLGLCSIGFSSIITSSKYELQVLHKESSDLNSMRC